MSEKILDLIIVGAGPAGLTSAIYASRERMKTLVLEKKVPGGQAAITDVIGNYPGFPDGIKGGELAMRFREHAEKFGTKIESKEVTSISKDNNNFKVFTNDGDYTTRAVIIATGSDYKKLDVPGERELIGRGIHFCATCDGPFYKDKHITIIGAGNTAFQEAIFLSQFAKGITFLVRSDKIRASKILQEEVKKMGDYFDFKMDTSVKEFIGQGKLEKLIIVNNKTKKEEELITDGVFTFIGLVPNTKFLKGIVDLDEYGFIKSDNKFMTSVNGIFVAGDCRSGATAQIAAAVGEGAKATLMVRNYFESK